MVYVFINFLFGLLNLTGFSESKTIGNQIENKKKKSRLIETYLQRNQNLGI